MNRGNSLSRRKALSLLALAACMPAVPGCGGEPAKVDAPPEDKSSNREMIDFMKAQKEQKNKK